MKDTNKAYRLGYDTYQSTVFPGKNIVTSGIRRGSGIFGMKHKEDTRYRIVFQGEMINLRGR